jgi:MFS family permease
VVDSAAVRRPAPDLGGPFWRLWTSSTVSAAGDGLTFVAVPLLAARLTQDPAKIALVQTAEYTSWLLLGLVAGALADRWDRLRIMAVSDLFRAALFAAFAIAVASGRATLSLIVAVAFVAGLAGILNQNAASSVLPNVVPRDRLETANSWLQAGLTVPSSLIGPPLGGLLFVAAASLPFTVDAVSFAASGVIVLTLRGVVRRPVRTTAPPPLRAALGEGLRFLWRSQVLRTLCLLLAVVNGTQAAVVGIAILFVRETLGLPERGFGVLLAVLAVGGLAGTVAAPWARRRLGTSRIVAIVLAAEAGSFLATGLVPTLATTVVGFVLAGVCGGMWNVATISLRQRIVPDELLGRVTSAYRLVGLGSMPLGAAVGGLVAKAYGLPATFVVAGAGAALGLVAALHWLPSSVVAQAEAAASTPAD